MTGPTAAPVARRPAKAAGAGRLPERKVAGESIERRLDRRLRRRQIVVAAYHRKRDRPQQIQRDADHQIGLMRLDPDKAIHEPIEGKIVGTCRHRGKRRQQQPRAAKPTQRLNIVDYSGTKRQRPEDVSSRPLRASVYQYLLAAHLDELLDAPTGYRFGDVDIAFRIDASYGRRQVRRHCARDTVRCHKNRVRRTPARSALSSSQVLSLPRSTSTMSFWLVGLLLAR